VTIPLTLYLILRISDLFLRGVLPGALDGSWQSILFVAETCMGGLLPLSLLAFRKIRESREGLLTSAILSIGGIVSQRMSLSMFTMYQPAGMSYFPSVAETLIAFAIPAAAILVYLFFVENLAVVEGLVDGNRTAELVNFPHLEHQERLVNEQGEPSCQTCHHLNKPDDEATACSECHADYYEPQSIFDHTQHQQVLGGNASCVECHTQEHTHQTAEICQDCHETMTAREGQPSFNSLAPSYLDAMHGRCLECHQQEAGKQERPELALCSTCHTNSQDEPEQITRNQPEN
jgi:hypothetical protein